MPGWGAPQATQGFKTGEYAGALVLVTVVAYEPSVPTTYGDKDAVTCHITTCYHPTDTTRNGEGFANARIFNAAIVGSLRNGVGTTVGGRITLGQSKQGGTKYTLDEVSDANSAAYLDHYWPQHCEAFGVNKDDGTLMEKAKPAQPDLPTPPAPEQQPQNTIPFPEQRQGQTPPMPPAPPQQGSTPPF